MISFRDRTCELSTAEQLRRLEYLVRTGDAESFLVEAGMLEQAVVDALAPVEDSWGPVQAMLRDLVGIAGACYVDSLAGGRTTAALDSALPLLAELARAGLPSTVTGSIPEGYLHYALDPRDYANAAADYLREVPNRTREAVVIGLRSIGTSLSGVVAAVIGASRTVTLRPRGPSGSRYVATDELLSKRLRRWIEEGRDVLVVDEGPGATGETLYCLGQWLAALSVRGNRLVLFPSHTGGMALAPQERRDWFAVQRKYPPHVHGERMSRITALLGLSEPRDLSGGLWRGFVPGASDAAASVNHERLKYLARDEEGHRVLIRYAGLGIWGQETVARAERLAELGIGPAVHGSAGGFMAYRWQEGHLASDSETRSPAFLDGLRAYLGGRWGAFRTGETHSARSIIPALLENGREALGENPPGLRRAVKLLESMPETESVIADARLRPSEWMRNGGGYFKTDAIDHGNGTRLPGPVGAAWDFAGAAVEYGLCDSDVMSLIDGLRLGEPDRVGLRASVAAYRAPYAACCLGEADIAAREAGYGEDRRRLEREAARYTALLRRELERWV
ncbi:MAG TPA: hypothetical protein VFG50_07980 [Rhodothermales bacterium]|nr:hypothetical protein [Rhodothermales bacterium]